MGGGGTDLMFVEPKFLPNCDIFSNPFTLMQTADMRTLKETQANKIHKTKFGLLIESTVLWITTKKKSQS